MMIIVDTTVLAALMVEPATPEAVEQLRRRHPEWAAPDLWRHELINVTWKYIQAGQLMVADASAILRETDLVMHEHTYRVPPARVLTVALDYGISTYDAHFVALASEMSTLLFTHDRALIVRCPNIARHPSDRA